MDLMKRSTIEKWIRVELLRTLTFYGDGMQTSIHSPIFHVTKVEGQDKEEKRYDVKEEEVLMMLSR